MKKELTRRQLEQLYLPPADDFTMVDVPDMPFFMLDGEGAQDRGPLEKAVQWLFTVIHPIKQEARKRMGRSFVEPPLECLWWADDMADFAAGRKDKLRWRMMIPGPGWATGAVDGAGTGAGAGADRRADQGRQERDLRHRRAYLELGRMGGADRAGADGGRA